MPPVNNNVPIGSFVVQQGNVNVGTFTGLALGPNMVARAQGQNLSLNAAVSVTPLLSLLGVIFRPGVPSGGNHVATWAEVEAAITAAQGFLTVFVDNTFAPCVVPAAADTDCFHRTIFSTLSLNNGYVLTIADGGRLRRPVCFRGPMEVHAAPTAIFPIEMGVEQSLLMQAGAKLVSDPGALVAMLHTNNPNFIHAMILGAEMSNAASPGVPIVQISPVSAYAWVNTEAVAGGLSATLVAGDATTAFFFAHDSTVEFVPQVLALGSSTEFRTSKAQAELPSQGDLLNEPAQPFGGQMFWNRTLLAPEFWDDVASVWRNPQSQVVFRPGVPAGQGHVTKWAEVASVIANATTEFTVFVDDRFAPASVDVSAVTDCKSLVTIRSFNGRAIQTLTVNDGDTLRDLVKLDGIQLAFQTTAVPGLDFTYPFDSQTSTLGLVNGAQLANFGSAVACVVTDGNTLKVSSTQQSGGSPGGGAFQGGAGQELFEVEPTANLLFLLRGENVFGDDTIRDNGAPPAAPHGVFVDYDTNLVNQANEPFPTFAGYAGNLQFAPDVSRYMAPNAAYATDRTAKPGEHVPVDPSLGAINVTLPDNAKNGDAVSVKSVVISVNTVTVIAPLGFTIDAAATDSFVPSPNRIGRTYVLVGTNWDIQSQYG